MMMLRRSILAAIFLFLLDESHAYYPSFAKTRRFALTMKRGRGSFQEGFGDGAGSQPSGLQSSSTSQTRLNWIPLPKTNKLPKEDNKVSLLDTELITLKNAATNPTGAVAVVNFEGQTYCFSSACPSCKIPLTKAKVISPAAEEKGPRLVCDFCKATYNLSTGAKMESAEKAGFFGGVIQNVLSAQESGPLPTYKLGEKGGKLLISFD